jgi:16S rRNA (uracil1498-N3)-methyltransferase
MHRFFIKKISGNSASLTDAEQLHHLRDVLRLKINGRVILCDGLGGEYTGRIIAIDKKKAELEVLPAAPARTPSTGLTIACAIPKNSRMDDVIDYLTQLGVNRIIPMRTDRVVVKLDAAAAKARLQRWRKIAVSAARQSQRNVIPEVEAITNFADVVSASSKFDLKMIPHLSGDRKPIKDVLVEKKPKDIIVLIGPEGDFTPAEVELALHNGFTPVSLGDTVLRVAAAAIAAAAYIRFSLDE